MKKWQVMIAAGVVIFVFSLCGQKNMEEKADIMLDIDPISQKVDETSSYWNEDATYDVSTQQTDKKSEHDGNEDSVSVVDEKVVDYKALGIKEYEYPAGFVMRDNLKVAITQLALSYENFDQTSVDSEEWKETFIARFIQNSRVSFAYLDEVSDKNNGQVSIDKLNYIQYSLTGKELDLSSYVDGTLNRYDAASSLNYGWIAEYDYTSTDVGAIVTAILEVGHDGADDIETRNHSRTGQKSIQLL